LDNSADWIPAGRSVFDNFSRLKGGCGQDCYFLRGTSVASS